MKLNGALPLTVGIEVEFALRGHTQRRPRYGSMEYAHELRKLDTALRENDLSDKWGSATDYSCGLEVVSKPMATMEDVKNISKVINMLVSMGFKTDSQCGLHIHVGGFRNDTEALKRIAHFVYRYQEAFFLLAGRNRQNNEFCRKNRQQIEAFKRDPEGFLNRFNSNVRYNNDRYGWVNFHALRKHGTVELRLPESKLSSRYITNWVKLVVMLFETIVVKGKKVQWGEAKAKSKKILINTLLEQAGIRDKDNDQSLRLSVKNWALKRCSELHSDFDARIAEPQATAAQGRRRTISNLEEDMRAIIETPATQSRPRRRLRRLRTSTLA